MINKYEEMASAKFAKAARGFDRPPVVLSLREQLLKCGTTQEKTAIRRRDISLAAIAEQEKVQQYETEPGINGFN